MLKKEAKKDYQREYMKRKRSNRGSNIATSERSNRPVGSNKGLTDVPELARVLPLTTINRVKAVLINRALKGLHDDSKDRWLRAVSYHEWELAGRPVNE